MSTLRQAISCVSDYDPDALPVAKANEVIRSFVDPLVQPLDQVCGEKG